MFSLIGIRFRGGAGKWLNTDGLWGNKTFIRRLTNTMDGQTERQQLGQRLTPSQIAWWGSLKRLQSPLGNSGNLVL